MKMRIQYIISTVILLLLISCNSSVKQANEQIDSSPEDSSTVHVTKAQFEETKMELGKLSEQEFSERIRTNGFIDVPPANKARVSAVIGGFVKASPLLVGNKVKKGQLLLTMENPEFVQLQQDYLEVAEQLNYLKNESDRQKTLFDEKIASEKNFLKAESNYKSALATFKGLENRLNLLRLNPSEVLKGNISSTAGVYAPISGSITEVHAHVGEYMEATDVLLEIINNEHNHLELTVFEKDVLKVRSGQTIEFRIPEASAKDYFAKVYLVGKEIGEERTVTVHGHLEDENDALLTGMFVEADILVNSQQKKALPVNALLEEDERYSVLVLRERDEQSYIFERITVQIGQQQEDWVVILNSEELQDAEILVKGAFLPLE